MATRKDTCTTEQFWICVAEIGWQEKNTRQFYRDAEARLLREWDNTFLSSFREHLSQFGRELRRAVEHYEKTMDVSCACSDDGFSDLICHIIGLGKEEYEASLKDPMRVVQRGREQRFEESFSYCIPWSPKLKANEEGLTFERALEKAREKHPDTEDQFLYAEYLMGDKAKLDPHYYAMWAARELVDLKALWRSDFAGAFAHLTELVTLFERVAKGEVEVVLKHPDLKNRVRDLRKKREVLYQQKLKELEVLRGQGWGLDNLVSDMHQYLGDKRSDQV